MFISICAIDQNNLMGITNRNGDQDLPRYLSEDFRFFKERTMGSAIIMGRKTLDSLPGILPGRPHIYLSRSRENKIPGAHLVHSLQEALELAQQLSDSPDQYLIGGAEMIKLALEEDVLDQMLITQVFYEFETDREGIYYPDFDKTKRERHELSEILTSTKSRPEGLSYQFLKYSKSTNDS